MQIGERNRPTYIPLPLLPIRQTRPLLGTHAPATAAPPCRRPRPYLIFFCARGVKVASNGGHAVLILRDKPGFSAPTASSRSDCPC